MKSIKFFFKYLIKKHIVLFVLLIISFLVSLFELLFHMYFFPRYWWFGFIFYIPFFVVSTFTFIVTKIDSIKINKHLERIINFIISCLNIFIIFVIQICFVLFFLTLAVAFNDADMLNKVENYEKNFSHFPAEKIVHFPKCIPQKAKNIQIYSDAITFQGSQVFVLKFDIDKTYIKNELTKYKFKYKETPNHYAFWAITNNHKINTDGFIFYVIDGTLDRYAQNYGIAVNKNFSQIIYYYSNPDWFITKNISFNYYNRAYKISTKNP